MKVKSLYFLRANKYWIFLIILFITIFSSFNLFLSKIIRLIIVHEQDEISLSNFFRNSMGKGIINTIVGILCMR